MSVVGVIIKMTGGNMRNSHIYLNDVGFLLPDSVIGGANEIDKAREELTVEFVPGSTIKSDIAGDKMILRKRQPVREFFELADVIEGDRIVFEQLAPMNFRISKLSR
jgi:hypothetical protein